MLRHKVNFEVRTTVHSELIDKNDLRKMISFLEDSGYTGNYYIQNFVNDTKTLGNLSRSQRILTAEDFASSGIQVIFRA